MLYIATPRTIFPLGTRLLTIYDTCMDDHNHTLHAKDDIDHPVSFPTSPLVSETCLHALATLSGENSAQSKSMIALKDSSDLQPGKFSYVLFPG